MRAQIVLAFMLEVKLSSSTHDSFLISLHFRFPLPMHVLGEVEEAEVEEAEVEEPKVGPVSPVLALAAMANQ